MGFSNLSNPPTVHNSYYIRLNVLVGVFTILAILAVGLRFWARKIKKLSWALDDYLIALALIPTLGDTALNLYGCISPAIYVMQGPEGVNKVMALYAKVEFIGPLVWVVSVTIIRASIIVLYIRIFTTRTFRRLCYSILIINLAFCLSTILTLCLICRPISYRWDHSIRGGTCGRLQSLDLFIAVVTLLLDICLVLMPMPILWGLKMGTGRKVALTGIFGIGIVVCAITLYRIYVTQHISKGAGDPAYGVIGPLASLEALFGIINACLPLLKPVFSKMSCCVFNRRGDGGINNRKRKENTPSGSIPIMLRISHAWSKSLGQYTAGDEGISSPMAHNDSSSLNAAENGLRDPRVSTTIETKVPEISICKDVVVERSLSVNRVSPKEKSAGNYTRWWAETPTVDSHESGCT